MLRKLVWTWVLARIAKQMWSERKWWFKPMPMTMKRMDQLLKDLYITPLREQLNQPMEKWILATQPPTQSTYNVNRG